MVNAILQARASSTRLPGKVMRPILGLPMLARQVERLSHSRMIERLIIATSTESSDDPVLELGGQIGIDVFRGDLDDVLDRFYQAARSYPSEHIVRLTGDCPLADPFLIDQLINFHLEGGFDYSSNCLEPSFPDGLDAEVVRYSALERAWREARLPSEREHVTPYLYNNNKFFKIGSFKNATDLSHLRWTVDEAPDLELVNRIYAALYSEGSVFSTREIINYLDSHPELNELNSHYRRNEGFLKSLARDVLVEKDNQEE